MQLYVQVFRFLCYAMTFYQSRRNRIKASLNQNFYNDQVQKMVNEIQRSVQLIRRESEFMTQSRVENTQIQVYKLADHILDLKIAGGDTRNDDIRAINHKLDLMFSLLKTTGQGSTNSVLELGDTEASCMWFMGYIRAYQRR